MEWDEKGRQLVGDDHTAVHPQMRDARKACDPTTGFRVCGCDDMGTADYERFGVICRGGRGVWKRLLPRFQGPPGMERDVGEKMLPGARDPGFRDETTLLECLRTGL